MPSGSCYVKESGDDRCIFHGLGGGVRGQNRESTLSRTEREAHTFIHLADAFIQSDFEPTTFALLTQCSTTEPQEHTCSRFTTVTSSENFFAFSQEKLLLWHSTEAVAFFTPRPRPYFPCLLSCLVSSIERLSLHCSPN